MVSLLIIGSTLGADLTWRSGRRPAYLRESASFSSFDRLGGSFGNEVGSYAGARMRFTSPNELIDAAFDVPDRDDLPVATELTDSFEPRRLRPSSVICEGASDGRLGGNAGVTCSDVLLGGKAGPALEVDEAMEGRVGRGGLAGGLL